MPSSSRIGGEAGALEALGGKGAFVDDDQCAGNEIRQVHGERGRVEGDQHVRRIPGRGDAVAPELYLEGGNAIEGAGRRADLRRKVRQGGEVVAGQRRCHGELLALQLNAVAGIAGEAHHVADRIGEFVRQKSLPGQSGLRKKGGDFSRNRAPALRF